jgi:hypothetical protein
MDEQTLNTLMNTYGVSSAGFNFSWPNIIGGIVFGIIGFYAFNYGRKEKAYKPLAIGLVLMVYPYFVSNTIMLYVLGIAISSLLYFWRD